VAVRRQAGLAYIPEDRYTRGLAADASITDNLLMGAHDRPPAARGRLLNPAVAGRRARALVAQFGIRTRNPDNAVRTLSGGNAQRVVVARELAEAQPLVIAAQPTRGIDIGATEFVRGELLRRRDEGAAVLLISADLAEVLSLSDRVVVLYRGRIVGELAAADATEVNVGLLMAGVRPAGVRAGPQRLPDTPDPGVAPPVPTLPPMPPVPPAEGQGRAGSAP
jgi:simple sugar transport system ATP-binding protein